MMKAIARSFRWRKLIETGVYASIEELARAEKDNSSYVGRVLRLTLLAPEIIEAIMEGRQPAGMTMAGLLTGFPVVWAEQRARLRAQRLDTCERAPTSASESAVRQNRNRITPKGEAGQACGHS
jgi:hypothetical protein